MPPPVDRPPRYRRRIVSVGGVLLFALLVVGGPIYTNRIEDDLERRVPADLAAAGFDGIQAVFSGQDGLLACARPLVDPEAAVELAYDVWGVRAIDLDRSCRVNRAPVVDTTTTSIAGDATTDPSDDVTVSEVPPTTTDVADFASIAEIVSSSPELALLWVLLQESGLDATLADPAAGPYTLFAPTNTALDALGADSLAQLRSDPDLLLRVLEHHIANGAPASADLPAGPLTMLDGSGVDVRRSGSTLRIGPASVLTADLPAVNGAVHTVDRVLVPDDVDLSPAEAPAEVAVVYADDGMTLRGIVASEVERAALVNAAAGVVADVVDELTVDSAVGLDSATATTLAQVVAALPAHLVAAVAGFDGESLYVRGSYAGATDRDALLAIVGPLGVIAELAERPTATVDDAARLEAELNEFVAANPILFAPGSAALDVSAAPILDRVARGLRGFAGLTVAVEGHTDSDGLAPANLALSQQRADAVRDALVARGVDEASITAEGFGSERPVLVQGVEDKAASRRVEFRVVAA